MKREEYLKNHWLAYPELPENTLVAGRIYRLETREQGVRIEILRAGQFHKLDFSQPSEVIQFLKVGDLVAITDQQEVVLLSPSLGSLPRDTVDLSLLQKWNLFETQIRSFFQAREFVHLQTPSLVPCPGTEPSLDVFSTQLQVGSLKRKLYLPTSPEIHLKKALALGADKVFEICKVFRNGEITERHQPEFLMLEWYRAYDNLKSIQRDVVELVQALAQTLQVPAPSAIKSYSVKELFQIHCGFSLKPTTSASELKQLAENLKVDVRSAESIDDYFFLIFMEKIENQLIGEELVFVTDYPPYQAALARLTSEGWGDRFEVYWKGLELGNAFHELNDPSVQRLRSSEDLQKKKEMGKEEISLDEEFFQCLEAGMPPSGGIAMGVERLFMALTDTKEISNLKVFPYSRY